MPPPKKLHFQSVEGESKAGKRFTQVNPLTGKLAQGKKTRAGGPKGGSQRKSKEEGEAGYCRA